MNKHSIRYRGGKHSRSKHSRSKRSISKRRSIRYRYSNKTTKRLIRLKRKTRRIKGARRMRGGNKGDQVTTTPSGAKITISQPVVNVQQTSSSSPNTKLGGGGGGGGGGSCMNKNKQYGGNSILDLYAYKPPPGMMGPVPQPSQDATSNQLILQAAKISTTGQANAQFDDNVKTCKG